MARKRKAVLPTVRITDAKFKYTSSVDTDLSKTFARIRRQMKAKAAAGDANVLPIADKRKAKA